MRANETAYRRIYEDLRDKIVAGDWPAGARLPSKRQTAADYGVSVITAEHAYSLLCDEGYAEARERSGTYAAYRPKDRFPVGGTRGTPPPPQPHAGGDFPYSVYAKAVRRVLADYEGILYEKSPAGGLPLLRRTLADYLARSRGIRTDPENILIGSGSEYCYTLIPMILGRDRIYAVESPSYGQILYIYRASGITCEELPLAENGIDSAALEASRAEVLHITPYRSYPSMVTASASKRHEYLRWAKERGGWLIEDDVESEFSPRARPTETLFSLDGERVIYLNTFSKTLFPSLRAAYMVLPSDLLPAYRRTAGHLSCTVPVLEQCLLAELIGRGDFERHLNRMRRRLGKAKP
ncbi:MAG: PLP-dependent aminotransferase family protein [Clostridiales bacterium]|nr:PLP-dependent aminotransferase family protein [Clostridiales bacterium]